MIVNAIINRVSNCRRMSSCLSVQLRASLKTSKGQARAGVNRNPYPKGRPPSNHNDTMRTFTSPDRSETWVSCLIEGNNPAIRRQALPVIRGKTPGWNIRLSRWKCTSADENIREASAWVQVYRIRDPGTMISSGFCCCQIISCELVPWFDYTPLIHIVLPRLWQSPFL